MSSSVANAAEFQDFGKPIARPVYQVDASGNPITASNPAPVNVEVAFDLAAAAGYVALTSPPSATNAGSDTALTFSSQVNQIVLENNTSANVYYAFDTAATLGSLVLAPGYMLVYPKKVTVLHLYTVAAQNINGVAVGAIVVLGEL